MRRALFLLVAWGALVLPTTWIVGNSRGGLPSGGRPSSLRFAEATHDFGTVIEGDEVSHVFRCRNTSSEAVRLRQALGSCGCVAAVVESDPLVPAGGVASIRVTFYTETKVGTQHAHVRLWTDEREADPIVLRMEGRVDRVVSVEPRAIYADLVTGEERSVDVRVDFLRKVARPGARVVGDLVRAVPDWEAGLLHLPLRAPATPGHYQAEVEVGFDLETGRRQLTIPVRIAVREEGKP